MTLLATVTGLPLAIMTTDDSQLQQCLRDCHCSSGLFNLKFNCANLNHESCESMITAGPANWLQPTRTAARLTTRNELMMTLGPDSESRTIEGHAGPRACSESGATRRRLTGAGRPGPPRH